MKAKLIIPYLCLFIGIGVVSSCQKNSKNGDSSIQHEKPNIILFYADDVGYGDLSSYGAQSISTPHIDWLAEQGIRFTNAHSAASTCTPSRYTLLTGRYAFRKKGTGIASGNAPLIIDTSRVTLADVLDRVGYRTAVIGKWHLGLGSPPEGPNWNGVIKPGPLELGFDYSFIIPATNDRVPTVYVENHRVFNYNPFDPIRVSYQQPIGNRPTGAKNPEMLRMKSSAGHNGTIINGIARIGYMAGGQTAVWDDSLMSEVLTAHALNFIKKNQNHPFFLFFATPNVHVPRVPNRQFIGKSGMGPRGDALLEMDWQMGQILQVLDSLNIEKNTMIIFTSDNGPVLDDGYRDWAVQGARHPETTCCPIGLPDYRPDEAAREMKYSDAASYNKNSVPPHDHHLPPHKPAGPLRGGKYSIYEGGTRVPFIVYWPGHTKEGMVSDALISQVDLLASFAALTGQKLNKNAGPDSFNMLPVLLGKTTKGRKTLIVQSGGPHPLALIKGHWKYIQPAPDKPAVSSWARLLEGYIELGNSDKPQLYNLKKDLGETNNLAEEYPKKIEKMSQTLQKIVNRGQNRKQ